MVTQYMLFYILFVPLVFLKIIILCTANEQLPSSLALIKQPDKFDEFHGIPASFGDLNSDKRTDIVVITDDAKGINIYYQKEDKPTFYSKGSCRSNKQISQIYLAELHNNAKVSILVLLKDEKDGQKILKLYELLFNHETGLQSHTSKSDSSATYSLISPTQGLENFESSKYVPTNKTTSTSIEPPIQFSSCILRDLNVSLSAQPLIFDLNGDLRIDLMGPNLDGEICVWTLEDGKFDLNNSSSGSQVWKEIKSIYFGTMHSNSFIDINGDNVADIVLSSNGHIMYMFAHIDSNVTFKIDHTFLPLNNETHTFGQSTLVDYNADGVIEHLLPVCSKDSCCIVQLERDGYQEVVFNLTEQSEHNNFRFQDVTFAAYTFTNFMRPVDLDGDGYTDMLVVAKDRLGNNEILYLRNVRKGLKRTFQVIVITKPKLPENYEIKIVAPFDLNEDGKMDLLIGSGPNGTQQGEKPEDMIITAQMNSQMVDACFMKVIVTNGNEDQDSKSYGTSAVGPFSCFELNLNDGNIMKGCAGQLTQSSHFALQVPYTVFGLGQTAHFVEKLMVTIPGFSASHNVRTKFIEQIVPDAQIIIIPNDLDHPEQWGYKLFLSPMSRLALSTLVALAVICLVLLVLILILHRKELKEDAAEHEEYRRHWPESRY